MGIMARQAEDEPDYLKELLAQAGIDAQASSVLSGRRQIAFIDAEASVAWNGKR